MLRRTAFAELLRAKDEFPLIQEPRQRAEHNFRQALDVGALAKVVLRVGRIELRSITPPR